MANQKQNEDVLDNIGIGLATISPSMEILSLNRQMLEWFPHVKLADRPICFQAYNTPPREEVCTYCPTIKTLKDGQTHEAITDTPTPNGIVHFRLVSYPVKSPTGEIKAAIETVEDVTARIREERAIKTLAEQQSNALLELSTPVLQVWDHVVVMPLIGIIDSRRARQIEEQLLHAITTRHASVAIIDITGISQIDTGFANNLIDTFKAAKLLGTNVMLTGVSPAVSQTIVSLGVDLGGVITKRTLQEGLKTVIGQQ